MLTGKQKRYLRSLAQNYSAIIQVGKNGVSDNLIETLENSLIAHELVKVSVLQNCMIDKKEVAETLSNNTDSDIVQIIGRTIIFYRKNEEEPKIELP